MIKKYHISKNLLNLSGNQYFNYDSSVIGVDGEKLICDYIASGASSRIIYSKYYPAGTYTVSCKLNNLSKLRILSPENFGGTWNSFYNGYYIDADSSNTITITSNVDFRLGFVFTGTAGQAGYFYDIMLNTGSQPLPYEPYGNTWNRIPYRQYHLNATSLTSDEITTDGSNVDVIIDGNMVQSGTPTPSIPIQPQECGDRTENLFDKPFTAGYHLDITTGLPTAFGNQSRCATLTPIDVSNLNTVTLTFNNLSPDAKNYMYSLFNGTTLIDRTAGKVSGDSIDVSSGTALYLCVYSPIVSADVSQRISNIMLNLGSTALPYEPYGYKIPVTVNSTTTNIYLGDVQSTRQIKKLVLDGTEEWLTLSANLFRITVNGYLRENNIVIGICSHLKNGTATPVAPNPSANEIRFLISGSGNNYVYFTPNNMPALSDWTTFLSSQYAAGTPVTIWYILAEPTTGIVNEPIRKIGDYADSISVANIPTIVGTQTFTVNTTLAPSDIKVSNWWENMGYEKIYKNNDWWLNNSVAYWQQFTIAEMQQKTIYELQGGN